MPRRELPVATRRAIVRSLLALAVLAALLFPLSGFGRAHLRIKDGIVFSLREGRAELFIWDTSFYRINYEPGLSYVVEGYHLDWWPRVHLGGPPAGYALPGEHQWVVSIPFWLISLLLVAAWWAARRAFWRRPWQCLRCGYDLRGLSAGVTRCPECGRPARTPD